MNGHTLVVEQLIAAGADLNVKFNEGYGPWADCDGFALSEPASRLLGRSTALIYAALKGHTLVVEQLIAAGAALDVQNGKGCGPCADCNGVTPVLSEPTDVSAGTLRCVARRAMVTAESYPLSSSPAPMEA